MQLYSSDRVITPVQTLENVTPFMKQYGITRLAKQTNLDVIGIPCFAAFRPNARALTANQGKGLTDDAAKVSAVMEAIEFAVAEQPEVSSFFAAQIDFARDHLQTVACEHLMALGSTLDAETPLQWLQGEHLLSGQKTYAPRDAIAIGSAPNELEIPKLCQTTNGLASGNTYQEAVFHGLCELIERDAETLWSLKSIAQKRATALSPWHIDDPHVQSIVRELEARDFSLQLFTQTAPDIPIPTVMAVITENGPQSTKYYDVSSGTGTHPKLGYAVIRALTEAAQTSVRHHIIMDR